MAEKIKNNRLLIGLYMIIAAVLVIGNVAVIDNDFYHIAVSGKEILADWNNMYENTHFVKEGYGNVIQQWAYSVMLYKSYDIAGFTGVRIFTLIQYVLLLYAAYAFLKEKASKQMALIGSLIVPLCLANYVSCRPQMISLILILAQFTVVEKYRKSGKTRLLYLLPLFTLVEVNVHLTFGLFHFVFLLPYLVPTVQPIKRFGITKDNLPVKPFIIPMVLMALVMLANPYTYRSYTLLAESGDINALQIGELQPLNMLSSHFVIFMTGVGAFSFLAFRKKITSTSLYLFFGTVLMYALAMRNVIFYNVTILYLFSEIAAYIGKDKLAEFYGVIRKASRRVNGVAVAGITTIALAGCAAMIWRTSPEENVAETKMIYDVTDYLKENEADMSKVKLFTPFRTGSHFLWNGVGHIYLEPKTEPYIKSVNGKKDIIAEYCYIRDIADGTGIEKFLEEYDFDYLYTDANMHNLNTYLSLSDEYECVVSSDSKGKEGLKYVQFHLYKHIR